MLGESEKNLKNTRFKLSEQAALMLNLKYITTQLAKGDDVIRNKKRYQNFSVFRGGFASSGGHLALTKYLYRNRYINKMVNDIPNNVMSSILPSIKLYKVFFPGALKKENKVSKESDGYAWRIPIDDIPVKFDPFTSEFQTAAPDKLSGEQLLSSGGRMHGIGIKSFTYKFVGTNPAEVNTNIEADLELFFQNVSDLLKEIPVNKENFGSKVPSDITGMKFNFSDLVGDVEGNIKGSNEGYNEKYFRIKAVIGYSEPSIDFIKSLGYTEVESKEILYSIRAAKVILYLNPHNHDISFEENGTITIKIQYIAAMTSLMSSINALNVSGKYKEAEEAEKQYQLKAKEKQKELDKLNSKECRELTESEIQKRTDLIEEKYKQQLESVESILNLKRKDLQSSFFDILVGRYTNNPLIYSLILNKKALGIENTAEEFDDSKFDQDKTRLSHLAEAKAIDSFTKTRYSSIEDANIVVNAGAATADKSDGSFLGNLNERGINTQIQKQYKIQKLKDAIEEIEKKLKSTDLTEGERQLYEDELKKNKSEVDDLESFVGDLKDWFGNAFDTATASKDSQNSSTQKSKEALEKAQKETNPISNPNSLLYKVNFLFLGDIFDILCSSFGSFNKTEIPRILTMEFDIYVPISADVIPSKNKDGEKTEEIKNIKYETVTINLADLPISLYMLEDFLIEKIVKTGRIKYPLISFFNDLVTDVVGPAVSPSVFGSGDLLNKSVRVSTLNISLPFDNKGNDLLLNESKSNQFNKIFNPGNIPDDLPTKVLENSSLEGEIGNYLIFYCSNRLPNIIKKNNGNTKEDEKDGIYHYFVGTDNSILKKLKFKRNNTQFYKEAKNSGTGGETTGRMQETYDCDLSMFGNNIYRPGDYLYVEPLFFTGNQAVDLQRKIGLGGYYQVIDVQTSINENIYETTMNTTLYGHIKEENGKKTVVEDTNVKGC